MLKIVDGIVLAVPILIPLPPVLGALWLLTR